MMDTAFHRVSTTGSHREGSAAVVTTVIWPVTTQVIHQQPKLQKQTQLANLALTVPTTYLLKHTLVFFTFLS